MSKICVYACGGCGLNLVNPLEKLVETPTAGFAEINPVYIDTSKSNLAGIKDSGSVYLVEGLDGSGKKRNTLAFALKVARMASAIFAADGDINGAAIVPSR